MICAALTEALARSSSAARWASFGLDRLLDLIDRQAGDVLAVVAAHLRQFVRFGIRRRRRRRRRGRTPRCRTADSQPGRHSRKARTCPHRCRRSRNPRTKDRSRSPTSCSHTCHNRRTARTAGRPSRSRHCHAATIRRAGPGHAHPAIAALAAICARVPGLCKAPWLCNAPATAPEVSALRTARDLMLAFRPATADRPATAELRTANERLPSAALFGQHRRAAADVDPVPLGDVLGRADGDGVGGHEGVVRLRGLLIASRCCW